MSTTIDSLDIQISTSVGNSAQKIEELASALGNLKNNGKITVAVNGLQKLANTLYSLQPAISKLDTSKLSELGTAMRGLSGVQKLSGLKSALETLAKIPIITRDIDTANVTRFATQMERLSKALAPLATQIDKIGNGFSKLPNQITKAVTATNKMTAATEKAATATADHGKSLDASGINIMAAIHNFNAVISTLQMVGNALHSTMGQAMEWEGIQFRFGRAFGEDAEEVYAYVQKVNDVLGINIQQFMQYSSLYGSLLSGFGMAQEKVTTISVGLTELSYDIWAAYNDRFKTLEDASEAVRSAITGEIEPIRNAGIALTEASMQEYLDGIGMATVSIEKLSEAQKAEVRYAAMMEAAMNQGIIGTYASEMKTAEGAVRGLSQSFKGLVQALGSLFIPILQAVIPYLTAFIQLLYQAISAIASFFGIAFFEIDWGNGAAEMASGLEDAAAGAGGVASGLGGAAKAAKKLRDYTMGFDELNVIKPPDESSGGGGGGAGGSGVDWGDGLDLETLWDESVFAKANQKVDEIKEKLKVILGLVGLVAAGIALWKIGSAFMTALDTVKLALKVIAGQNGVMGLTGARSALGLLTSTKTADAVAKLGDILRKTPIGGLILGSGSTSIGAAALAVAAVAASIAALVGGFVIVFKESENFRNGLVAIGEGAVWVFDKLGDMLSWIGDKISQFGGFVKEKLTDIIPDGILDFFDALDIGIGDLLITAGGLALFGPVGLLIEGAVLAIKGIGYATSDALPKVNLFGEGISEATREKVEPFIDKMDDLENTLNTLDWGNAIVGEDDLADISNKLKSVTDTIVAELDADKNEALAKLDPLKNALSEEKYDELLAKVEESYNSQVETVKDGENRINEILKTASDEARALTDDEAREIAKIQEKMKTTGIKYLSESETESNLILKQLKDNASKLTAEQASEVVKNALTARDETIKAAEEQYKGILLEAQRLLDTGTINETEYAEIVKAAETTRDETVSAAETQYTDIVNTAKTKMGEYAKYIDEETGELKTNWEVWTEDLGTAWSTFWSDTKKEAETKWDEIKLWFNTNVAPKFTRAYWQNVFDKVVSGVSSKLSELKGAIAAKWQTVVDWYNTTVAPKLKLSYWTDKISSFLDVGKEIVENIKEGLKEKWEELKKWWSELELPSFKIKKPHLEWGSKEATGWIADTLAALGLPTKIPDLKVEWYAQGGFPTTGNLFWASEAGPELVGTIGNRTAGANNDQIVAAVSQGVYSAVVAAMSSGGNNNAQSIHVYLDGKQIYSSVKKVEAERGVSLMGNQLGYVY